MPQFYESILVITSPGRYVLLQTLFIKNLIYFPKLSKSCSKLSERQQKVCLKVIFTFTSICFELFHVFLGLMWVWYLQMAWTEITGFLIGIAIIGSLLPDIDHLIYFFTYGKNDPYTRTIFSFIKKKEWKVLISFIENGNK